MPGRGSGWCSSLSAGRRNRPSVERSIRTTAKSPPARLRKAARSIRTWASDIEASMERVIKLRYGNARMGSIPREREQGARREPWLLALAYVQLELGLDVSQG